VSLFLLFIEKKNIFLRNSNYQIVKIRMRSFLKGLLSSKPIEKSLIKPLKDQQISRPYQDKWLSNKPTGNYPLGFQAKNEEFIRKVHQQRNKDEGELKMYWLEKWYIFRDKKLVYPIERLAYLLRLSLGILKKLASKNQTLYRNLEKLEGNIDKLQNNPRARAFFLPGLMILLILLISPIFVRII
jgi:hypothetical protein